MQNAKLFTVFIAVVLLSSAFVFTSSSAASEQGGFAAWLSKAGSFLFGTGGASTAVTGYQVSGNYCGDGVAGGSEACDWGSSFCGGNGNNVSGSTCTTSVACPGGYPSVSGKYRCKTDCSGFEYNTSNCGRCGDGTTQIGSGEQCDDRNTVSGDGCNSLCKKEAVGNILAVSTPAGASVYVDDVYKGVSPVTVSNIAVGSRVVKFVKAGYADYSVSVNVVAGGIAIVNPTLSPVSGSISASSSPGGAGVYVDGVLKGVSPVVIPSVVPGSRVVKFVKAGYADYSVSVSVVSGGKTIVNAVLVPAVLVPVCGNRILESGEQCDDGNTVAGDGCNSICKKEYCGDGVAGGSEACDWGSSFCGGNGNNVSGSTCTTSVACPGGYPSVTGKYRCNATCSAFVYDTSNCGGGGSPTADIGIPPNSFACTPLNPTTSNSITCSYIVNVSSTSSAIGVSRIWSISCPGMGAVCSGSSSSGALSAGTKNSYSFSCKVGSPVTSPNFCTAAVSVSAVGDTTSSSPTGNNAVSTTFTVRQSAGGGVVVVSKLSPCPASGVGDVNGDSYVTSADVTAVQSCIVGLSSCNVKRADVNADGVVDMADVLVIQKYISGAISTFPACLKPSPCPASGVGDVNGDGYVTSADVFAVQSCIMGSSSCNSKRADVNADGRIDMADVLVIKQYLAGTISTFPGCTKTSVASKVTRLMRLGSSP